MGTATLHPDSTRLIKFYSTEDLLLITLFPNNDSMGNSRITGIKLSVKGYRAPPAF